MSVIGHITIRVPVEHLHEIPSLEDPGADYLEYGTAELIEHDLNDKDLARLSIEIDYGDVMGNFEMPLALKEAADAALEASEPESDDDGPILLWPEEK